jgi:hypothetical protein
MVTTVPSFPLNVRKFTGDERVVFPQGTAV